MEADSKEHPPMLALEAMHNEKNRKLIDAEAKAVHMTLNGIKNDIYSTMDACPNAKEIWIAIEHLQIHLVHQHSRFNEIRAESIARNSNPLALVAATQNYPNDYYQAPPASKAYKYHTPSSRKTQSTRTNATNKNKGTKIVKQTSHQSKLASEEDNDEEQAQRDKQIRKVWLSLQSTSKTSKNLPITTSEPYQTLETRMLILLQELRITEILDEEPDEKEFKAHYMYMEKIQEVLHVIDDNSGPTNGFEPLEKVHTDDDYNVFATKRQHSEQSESINNIYLVEMDDSNIILDSTYMCDNEKKDEQNAREPEDECVLLASLIANFKPDVDENKKIQKQLKKENTSLTQELDKYKLDLKYCKIKLLRNNFSKNQKDREIVKLRCKEALDLLASNHKNAESLKTEAYRTFLVSEENAKLVNQISMQER
nr:hypothetical protein [Tanacetum cinerariifolium]